MLATAIHCVAGMLTSGIMSARCFQIQVPMFALVVASNALACYRLVPTCRPDWWRRWPWSLEPWYVLFWLPPSLAIYSGTR